MTESLIAGEDGLARCWWPGSDPLYVAYHDNEWGRPVTDDVRLFEKLCLEGFQAGLSWITILRKRENFRKAFNGFDWRRVARFDEKDVQRLLADAGIIRHRGKIEAVIGNARMMETHFSAPGSFSAYIWGFRPETGLPRLRDRADAMTRTTVPEAIALSKDLKKKGFRFVGPTTCYAFMQAMGLVDDHIAGCHCVK